MVIKCWENTLSFPSLASTGGKKADFYDRGRKVCKLKVIRWLRNKPLEIEFDVVVNWLLVEAGEAVDKLFGVFILLYKKMFMIVNRAFGRGWLKKF